jgi:hypothetical protein
MLTKFFDNQLKNSNRPPGFQFVNTMKTSVDDYVYAKRLASLKNIYGDYYAGMRLGLNSTGGVTGLGYHSKFAYHSAASILNELDSFLLAYYTNNPNRSIVTTNAPVAILDNNTANFNTSTLDLIDCFEIIPFSFIDFVDAILVSFMISICAIHATRERRNGSKFLQLLSGAHYSVYWTANYIFDMTLFLFNIITMVLALYFVSLGLDDTGNDVYILASSSSTLLYMVVYMVLTSFSWATLAYLWSFVFKRDVIAFITLFLLLGFVAFADMILVIVKFVAVMQLDSGLASAMNTMRTTIAILFPNVALKRAIFNLKLRNANSCIILLNSLFNSRILEFV